MNQDVNPPSAGDDDGLSDFRNFLYLVWSYLGLPEPTPVQYDFARYLQHGPRRLLGEAYRGMGKSWITSAFVCWTLRLHPDWNILVVSASKQRSDDFTTFTRRLIDEIPELQFLRPNEGQRDSRIAFDVGPAPAAHAPSVKSVGVLGQMTGSRADLIVADDVESLNNSATEMMREKLREVIKEFDAIIKPGKHSRIIYLGTPQTEASIYNILPQRGYSKRIWPARYPTREAVEVYGNSLAPMVRVALEEGNKEYGAPVDPKRFGEFELQEREASYGRSGFALQFMLDTRLSDADRHPLKLSDLVVMDLDPEVAAEKIVWASSPELALNELPNVGFDGDRYYRPMAVEGKHVPYEGGLLAIDPSGRGKDETGYAVLKILGGQLFALEVAGLAGGYEEGALESLAHIARRYKVNYVLVESNFGDGMFSQLLRPYLQRIYPCTIEEVRHNVQKERRIIDTLEPVMNQHRLIINKRVIEEDHRRTADLPVEQGLKYQLAYQMSRLTRDRGSLKHDDRLDVLAMAVAFYVERMAQDADAAIRDRQAERTDAALEDFLDHTLSREPKKQNWLDAAFAGNNTGQVEESKEVPAPRGRRTARLNLKMKRGE